MKYICFPVHVDNGDLEISTKVFETELKILIDVVTRLEDGEDVEKFCDNEELSRLYKRTINTALDNVANGAADCPLEGLEDYSFKKVRKYIQENFEIWADYPALDSLIEEDSDTPDETDCSVSEATYPSCVNKPEITQSESDEKFLRRKEQSQEVFAYYLACAKSRSIPEEHFPAEFLSAELFFRKNDIPINDYLVDYANALICYSPFDKGWLHCALPFVQIIARKKGDPAFDRLLKELSTKYEERFEYPESRELGKERIISESLEISE